MAPTSTEPTVTTAITKSPVHAPGTRVVIRDEEWIIRRVDPSSDGGELLVCDGVSELVRGRTAHFLTKLEERVPPGGRWFWPAPMTGWLT